MWSYLHKGQWSQNELKKYTTYLISSIRAHFMVTFSCFIFFVMSITILSVFIRSKDISNSYNLHSNDVMHNMTCQNMFLTKKKNNNMNVIKKNYILHFLVH
jgi:hypothetical protein